ncbi:MAG: response regulator [Lachnospiraceae bacterium]|nr:response regulator [Lachnospiraceae bacterium]
MSEVADRYANGDYSEKMEVERKDEVGALSRSLQTMSTSLVRQIELADSANKAKSQFLSNMSHEIRTPINAVLGFNEMILRESNDKNIQMYAENIRNSGHTLLGLINDILDFSKIEAGKIEIIPVDYNLSSVINDLVNMVRIRSQEKGLGLTLDFDSEIPILLNGDEIRIKQIITNILTNAVKYTERGYITFTIGYDRIESEPDHVMMNVSVKDTGIGIREEDMKKLFTEFERIDEKRNRAIEGTGLGMSITQSLLEMMGSSLKVESIYGVGSIFSFSLKQKVTKWEPLGDYKVSFEQETKEREHYRNKFTAKEARVLMVDDNATNLLVFENLLKQTLVQADSVTSGDECLNLCAKNKYDIIFLDHMMPGKDGIETLHEMNELVDSKNHDTPVICLTANAISGAREEYIKEGFEDYLTKPIDPDKLELMMIKYLPEEKCEKNTVPADDASTKEKAETNNEFDILAEQDLIDIYDGMAHCINKDVYINVLESYYDSIDETMSELNSFLAEEDVENYTIRIHAVKSTSKMIGANELGRKAELLEMAGHKGDFVCLHDNHKAFMEEYGKVRDELGKVFKR